MGNDFIRARPGTKGDVQEQTAGKMEKEITAVTVETWRGAQWAKTALPSRLPCALQPNTA